MATFTLDVSKLGGGQFNTVPFRMMGDFRDIQFRWYQSVANQDMEAHFLEFHMELVGIDESLT